VGEERSKEEEITTKTGILKGEGSDVSRKSK